MAINSGVFRILENDIEVSSFHWDDKLLKFDYHLLVEYCIWLPLWRDW